MALRQFTLTEDVKGVEVSDLGKSIYVLLSEDVEIINIGDSKFIIKPTISINLSRMNLYDLGLLNKIESYEINEDNTKFYDIVIIKDEKLIAALSLYNYYGHRIIEDKQLLVIYGYEKIMLFFFSDNTLESIYTR